MQHTKRFGWLLVILMIALAMGLAACGSDDDDNGDNGDNGESGDATSAISVSGAWVRASVPVGTMDDSMDDSMDADMDDTEASDMDMEDDAEDTDDSDDNDDSAEGDMDDMGDMSEGAAGSVTGAFMVIENAGDAADRLVSASVSADIASVVEIHETTLDENDVMKMRPVEGIDVPANGSVELKPGSYHIMLIDLQTALNPGDTVMLTLTFESGTTLDVEADVREMTG